MITWLYTVDVDQNKKENKMEQDKVLSGVKLGDTKVVSLQAKKDTLVEKATKLTAALEKLSGKIAEIDTKISEQPGVSARDDVVKMATALSEAGFKDEAINLALIKQFGKARKNASKTAHKAPAKQKRITDGLPDDATRDAILGAVNAAGDAGARMEDLYAAFAPNKDKDARIAVLATVKNAVLDGTVLKVPGTTARGQRYCSA